MRTQRAHLAHTEEHMRTRFAHPPIHQPRAGRSPAERDRLLHTVVVGGGPTGVEFAGELADFINRDLQKLDPDRARDMRVPCCCCRTCGCVFQGCVSGRAASSVTPKKPSSSLPHTRAHAHTHTLQVTVIEANELMGMFDAGLREYAARQLVEAGVHLMRGIVKEVREREVELKAGGQSFVDQFV